MATMKKHPNDPHMILTTVPSAVITVKRVPAPQAAGPMVKLSLSVPYAEVVTYLDSQQAAELRAALDAELAGEKA